MGLLEVILIALVVESLCEIITKSKIFKPLQDWADVPHPGFFQKLFGCAYCLSVWVASAAVGLYLAVPSVAVVVGYVFIVHRLSNYWHHVFEFFFWGAYALKYHYDR